MKKRMFIGIISAVVIIIATVIIFMPKESNPKTIKAYYFDEVGMLVERNVGLSIEDGESVYSAILNKMKERPSDGRLKSIFNKDSDVISITKAGRRITVDMSEEFLSGDDTRDSLCVYGVVLSLCQLREVGNVMVTVKGENVVLKNGDKLGFMSEKDINLGKKDEEKATKTLTLYFADKDYDLLVDEKRVVEITDTAITEEQLIVRELIKGTKASDARTVIIAGAKEELLSAETKDNICFVNFKASFKTKNTGNEANERLIIYSIVNSLCECDGIDSVQFLIDGQITANFGSVNISEPLSKNIALIK